MARVYMLTLALVLLASCIDAHKGWSGSYYCTGKTGSSCTCANPTTHEAVEVYTTTTGNSAQSTICVPKQACYKICTTVPCTTPTVSCIPQTTASKPGNCPTRNVLKVYRRWWSLSARWAYSTNTPTCTNDGSCEGKKKCCTLAPNTVATCVDPVDAGTKCGTCPTASASCSLTTTTTSWFSSTTFTEQACTADNNCPGSYKCCTCGAVMKCAKAVAPNTAPAAP